jgi:anthranilate phosphoribosyltransferase
VVGCADPALLPLIADALHQLGHIRALVVHGEPGLDEISPIGPTRIVELRDDGVSERVVDFRDLLAGHHFDSARLAGGDPADNARLVLEVLSGSAPDVARAAVVINAAAAIYIADLADSIEDGVRRAEEAIDTGAALAALDRLRDAASGAEPARR